MDRLHVQMKQTFQKPSKWCISFFLFHLVLQCLCVLQGGSQKFDPMSLEPDKVTLELEIGPSVVLLFGAWLRKFVHLKVSV